MVCLLGVGINIFLLPPPLKVSIHFLLFCVLLLSSESQLNDSSAYCRILTETMASYTEGGDVKYLSKCSEHCLLLVP